MQSTKHYRSISSFTFPQRWHVAAGAIIFVVSAVLYDFASDGALSHLSRGEGSEAAFAILSVLGSVGAGVTLVCLMRLLYTKLLWRGPARFGFGPPLLDSTYDGHIEYRDDAGKSIRIMVSIRAVRQEMDLVQLKLFSSDSKSTTLIGQYKVESSEPILYYVYRMTPTASAPHRDERYGAARLSYDVDEHLEGSYWTSDGRVGRIKFIPLAKNDKRAPSLPKKGLPGRSDSQAAPATVNDMHGLLEKIATKRGQNFSGFGMLMHDSSFDSRRHAPLSVHDSQLMGQNIFEASLFDDIMASCNEDNPIHDGFFIVDETGRIEACAQYLYPPFCPDIPPSGASGSRAHTAQCCSTLHGVYIVGIVSKSGAFAVYQKGKQIRYVIPPQPADVAEGHSREADNHCRYTPAPDSDNTLHI